MSHLTTLRGLRAAWHLKTHPSARFTELVKVLAPISRTALAHLLQSLCEAGELQKNGREYSLHADSSTLGACPIRGHTRKLLPLTRKTRA